MWWDDNLALSSMGPMICSFYDETLYKVTIYDKKAAVVKERDLYFIIGY